MASRLPELEEAVLGALLLEAGAWRKVEHVIGKELFADPKYAEVAEAVIEMYTCGIPVDIITVTHYMREKGSLSRAGGPATIVELTGKVASSANIVHHAYLLLQHWIRRALADASTEIKSSVMDASKSPLDTLDETLAAIRSIEKRISVGQETTLTEILAKAIERAEQAGLGHKSGVMTGMQGFDGLTKGIQPGVVTILGARPGTGKTAFAVSVALGAATEGHPVLFLSLEMLNYQLAWRMLSHRSRVPHHLLKDSRLTPEQWRRVVSAMADVAALPITVDDTGGLSYQDIRKRVLFWLSRLKPGKEPLVIIDYLQLVRGDGAGIKREQLERTSKEIAYLAKSEQIAILELSQLARYDRNDKPRPPDMRDLRGSGEIEEDAACIMFLHSDSMYGGGENHMEEVVREVIKEKDRFGPTGSISMYFNKDYQLFSDNPVASAPLSESNLTRIHFNPGELGRDDLLPE